MKWLEKSVLTIIAYVQSISPFLLILDWLLICNYKGQTGNCWRNELWETIPLMTLLLHCTVNKQRSNSLVVEARLLVKWTMNWRMKQNRKMDIIWNSDLLARKLSSLSPLWTSCLYWRNPEALWYRYCKRLSRTSALHLYREGCGFGSDETPSSSAFGIRWVQTGTTVLEWLSLD